MDVGTNAAYANKIKCAPSMTISGVYKPSSQRYSPAHMPHQQTYRSKIIHVFLQIRQTY